jgi:hypothetical protein
MENVNVILVTLKLLLSVYVFFYTYISKNVTLLVTHVPRDLLMVVRIVRNIGQTAQEHVFAIKDILKIILLPV